MYTRRTMTGVLLAVIVATLATLAGGAANAAAPVRASVGAPAGASAVGNNFQLRNLTTGKCTDVTGQSASTGAVVQQWDCLNQANQRWFPQDIGNGFMILRNQNSGLCMAVQDDVNANGTRIIQSDCNPADPGQQWRQVLLDLSGLSNVVSALGRCLEVNRAERQNGAKVQIWTCSSASNAQAWRFQ